MDSKLKLLSVASVVAVLISGCSGYNNQGSTGSNGYASGGSQGSNSGQVGAFGQRRPTQATTCTPCRTAPKTTYTYRAKPKTTYRAPAKKVYRAPVRTAGQHNQQYYIDRWNRQQNQQTTRKATPVRKATTTKTYNGYGSGYYTPVVGASSTTYYDYSSAGRTTRKATPNLSTSNKSIYTGSYQKRTYKPYKPTTYARGGSSTTAKRTTYARSTGGNTYIVKKGDTVFEIMRQTGVYWKDIIRLNKLRPPYNINPGQAIRLK